MAMQFLLADSFQTSLDKLNGEEQKAAKLAAFELQINPANPGLQCHGLDSIKDKIADGCAAPQRGRCGCQPGGDGGSRGAACEGDVLCQDWRQCACGRARPRSTRR
jgi:hypothetical protein